MKRSLILLMVLLLILLPTACKKKEEVQTPAEPTQTEPMTKEPEKVETKEVEVEPEIKTHPLFADRFPWAVMINNHPDARPQSGMDKAKIIYEGLVEGGISRLLMITDAKDSLIGPIRSARPNFFNFVAEFQAFYSHVGNYEYVQESPLANVIKDMDQFYHAGNAYYRETHRYAPHNMYANSDDLYEAAKSEGYELKIPKEGLGHFNQYDEFQPMEKGEAVKRIAFSYDDYTQQEYVYNAESKAFEKYIDGELVTEEFTGETIEIPNIIFLRRDHSLMPNGVHQRVDYVGEGEADYFTDGKHVKVTWKKESEEAPTKYFLDGKELILNPGLTFVNVVTESMEITIE